MVGDCAMWLEPLADGTTAITLVEPLDGDMEQLREPQPTGDGRNQHEAPGSTGR